MSMTPTHDTPARSSRIPALQHVPTTWMALLGLVALNASGCGGPTTAVQPPPTLPPVPRDILNADDLALASPREDDLRAPATPVLQTPMRRGLSSLQFSRDGERLFAISTHGELAVYDVATGRMRAWTRPWYEGSFPRLDVDASGSRVMITAQPFPIALWDLRRDLVTTLPAVEGEEGMGQAASLASLHPRGTSVARAAHISDGYWLLLQDALSGEVRQRVQLGSEEGAVEASKLEYSPSGARIALLLAEGSALSLRDGEDLSEVLRYDLPAPDGQQGEPEATGLRAQRSGSSSPTDLTFAFRPLGGQLALGRPGRVELRDSVTGRVRSDAPVAGTHVALQYSADSLWLLASSSEEVVLIEATTGHVSARVALDERASVRRVMPGRAGFIVDRAGSTPLIYDVNGVPLQDAAEAPTDDERRVYAPNGQWYVTLGRVPAVYHADEPEPRFSFASEGGQASVWGADFSLDGSVLFTRSRAGVSRWSAEGMRDLSCGREGQTTRTSDGQLVQGSRGRCLFDQDRSEDSAIVTSSDGRYRLRVDEGAPVLEDPTESRTTRLRPGRTSQVACETDRCLRNAQVAPDGSSVGFFGRAREAGHTRTWWEVYDPRRGRMRAHGELEDGYHRLHLGAEGAIVVHGDRTTTLFDSRGRRRLGYTDVLTMAMSPGGERLVVQTQDHSVHVVDLTTLRETSSFALDAALATLWVTPDLLRVQGLTNELVLFSVNIDGTEPRSWPHERENVALNFGGTFALLCASDRVVRVDLRTGATQDVADCVGRPAAISEDGGFAVVTMASTTYVHRLSDSAVLTLETLNREGDTLRVAYDSNGRWDASALDGQHLQIRAEGPGESAPLRDPDASAQTHGLVGTFLQGS